jgi:hypothetical protein
MKGIRKKHWKEIQEIQIDGSCPQIFTDYPGE